MLANIMGGVGGILLGQAISDVTHADFGTGMLFMLGIMMICQAISFAIQNKRS